jgi:hypothetical protein
MAAALVGGLPGDDRPDLAPGQAEDFQQGELPPALADRAQQRHAERQHRRRAQGQRQGQWLAAHLGRVHDRGAQHPGLPVGSARRSAGAGRADPRGQRCRVRAGGGSPDRIVWTFGASVGREAAEIAAGQADWTDDPLPGVAGLSARFPGQLHVNPLPAIVYTAFNTRVAPFSDPRVRQAFSLAADRGHFVSLLGGPDAAAPTCQILPPGIPGYQPYCPFSTDAGPSGTWVGPDLTVLRLPPR